MKFEIISLFPEFFTSPLKTSLLGKALNSDKFQVNIHNLRDFAIDKHHQVDDTPYGGGAGMVMKPDVLSEAIKKIKTNDSLVVLTDPGGQVFDQKMARDFSQKKNIILIAGRYEGVDERFKEKYVDLELSIGDYVLNGGEVACLVVLESVARLLPGVLGSKDSLEFESFSQQEVESKSYNLLEYPQYTKPELFENTSVPEILLSGDHQKIKKWRLEKSLEKTKKVRPDLLD